MLTSKATSPAWVTTKLVTIAALWMTVAGGAAAVAGRQISAARAAAIHECSVLAGRYPQHDWGNTEIYLYRACMAQHDQPE